MAFISCSECGNQVSDTATSCPHCGAPAGAAARESKADKLSIRELIGRLTVPQLWTALVALCGVLSGAVGFGYVVASNIDKVKFERLSIKEDSLKLEADSLKLEADSLKLEADSLKRESEGKSQKIEELRAQLQTQNTQLSSRLARLEGAYQAQNSLVTLLQLQKE